MKTNMANFEAIQVEALQAAADHFGRNWKSKLSQVWANGRYPSNLDSGTLQVIRNTYGPSWLDRYQLPKVKEVSINDHIEALTKRHGELIEAKYAMHAEAPDWQRLAGMCQAYKEIIMTMEASR